MCYRLLSRFHLSDMKNKGAELCTIRWIAKYFPIGLM